MPEARPILHHHLRRMTGRDPHEPGRVANPLELLFDLTFVISFAAASGGLADAIHHHNTGNGLIGFAFAMFAATWAWINYSWFASDFDTDDWFFRILTMVQMAGVVVFAVSLPAMFASLTPHGDDPIILDNTGMIIGYVVMRVAMIAQWLRGAVQSPKHRRTALIYVTSLAIAQIGWIFVAVLPLELLPTFVAMAPLFLIELSGPAVAERSAATPWHGHHIAERYGLLVIIALGEAMVGTEISVGALLEHEGWTPEIVVLAIAGVTLTFSLWWLWFLMPHGEALHEKGNVFAFPWGYGHFFVFAAITAIGAGLHVAGYAIEDPEHVSTVTALAWVAGPVAATLIAYESLRLLLVGWAHSTVSFGVGAVTIGLLALAVWLGAAGAPLSVGLLLIALAPAAQIVGDELWRHRYRAQALARLEAE